MTCFECGYENTKKKQTDVVFGVPLCETHKNNIKEVLNQMNGINQIGVLYYALKKIGLKPFIGWWNGQRHVPISLGRYRLNIEFYHADHPHNHKSALERQTNEAYDHQHNFICLYFPFELLNEHLESMVLLIHNMHEGLRNYQ